MHDARGSVGRARRRGERAAAPSAAYRAVTVALVASAVAPPGDVAVTRTAMAVPESCGGRATSIRWRPAIGFPSDSHCVASAASAGVHVPVDLVSVCPTSG
ncbi:hypothetical protein [Clavibacter zhangzhiyongii]|uniref:hypothetical protein n=1 Tax=Clavibacter zhangzhiyongii TaxID=2768071 RepID=UPI0039E0937D